MATTTISILMQNSNDAEFRAWGSAVSAALTAVGLTRTSDTGQIDFTTVLKPGGTNASAGYEMYRFSDTLQATAPVFIKFEYGTGGGVSNQAMWVTVGTGTNGAGSLTGQVGSRKQIANVSVIPSNATSYFSGANNRISFCLHASNQASNTGMVVSVERSKDVSGNDDGTGICLFAVSGGPNSSQNAIDQFVPAAGVLPAADLSAAVAAGTGSTGVTGVDVGVYPHFPIYGKANNPELGVISYKNPDITPLSIVPVTIYTVAHNYLALGNSAQGISWASRADTSMAGLLRYE